MKKNESYSDAPREIAEEIKGSERIEDFLPSPDEISQSVKKQQTVSVTMNLKKETLEQYERYAQKQGIDYHSFISALLEKYAQCL
ncbi:hypothetical protein QA601_00490 [Chitinispirillales bacterium ANBcel5]|uniref:CopG family transcriptional regulator n=1 Tax=Cellulosispirillum alkaliphilum TaxID=3039283 RepID=UPI002A566FCF|nr:hypothetical protein [Chitinispirillales bacterium ANBcel5]